MSETSDGPVRLLVLGAGNRGGHSYAAWCLEYPDEATVMAVADPDDDRRDLISTKHGIEPRHQYTSWREALAEKGPWDAVIVATPDRDHVDPAIRALELGYNILLEKPIAPTPDELQRLATAAQERPGAITVSHVMRYQPFFKTLHDLLEEGTIGELQGIEHAENIAYWHFAHSYVRGNWHRTESSSPMLLAKACHDLDMLRWLVGAPYSAVSSFGRRRYFRIENAPKGSTERCIDGCAVADTCPYNAERFYVEQLADIDGPPVTAMTTDTSVDGRMKGLRETDYGRCVFRMDNDAVDHQTVSLEFANGVTVSLVVSAFTSQNTRKITLMGSHGEIVGDLRTGRIETTRFIDTLPRVGKHAESGTISVGEPTDTVTADVAEAFGGHAGGDAGLMRDFTYRIRQRRAGHPVEAAASSLEESLESHWVAFAIERARLNGTVERP